MLVKFESKECGNAVRIIKFIKDFLNTDFKEAKEIYGNRKIYISPIQYSEFKCKLEELGGCIKQTSPEDINRRDITNFPEINIGDTYKINNTVFIITDVHMYIDNRDNIKFEYRSQCV